MTSLIFLPLVVTDAAAEHVTAVVDPKADWQLSKEFFCFLDVGQDTVFFRLLLERVSLSAAFSAALLAFSSAFFFAASSLAFLFFPQPSFWQLLPSLSSSALFLSSFLLLFLFLLFLSFLKNGRTLCTSEHSSTCYALYWWLFGSIWCRRWNDLD